MKEFLQRYYEAELLGSSCDQWIVHHIFLPKRYEDYFTFVTVRNPFDRILSAYRYFSHRQTPFYFLHSIPSITSQLSEPIKELECISVRLDGFVKIENLQSDFYKLPFVEIDRKIPQYNKSSNRYYRYSPELIELIRTQYKMDFESFNYDSENISGWEKAFQPLIL